MLHTIEIDGSKYPVKFGYGAFKILNYNWNCKGVQSVARKFEEMFKAGSEEVSFEQADMIGDLVVAGIVNADKTMDGVLDRDDVVQEILFDADKLNGIMQAFTESFPQSGNPQPRKPARKTTKKKK